MKDAIKDGKSLMENVFKRILLTQIIKDAEHGKMANVLNVQKDGTLMKKEFVTKYLIYAIHGQKKECVKCVIKGIFFKMESVSEIKISLRVKIILYAQHGIGMKNNVWNALKEPILMRMEFVQW